VLPRGVQSLVADEFVKRSEFDRLRSEIITEVHSMNDAAKVHVDGVVKALTQDIDLLKKETAAQTPILKKLSKRSRNAEIERVKRSGADALDRKNRLEADQKWRKWRTRILAILSMLVALGEAYRAWWPK
jgi:hypothetical protein